MRIDVSEPGNGHLITRRSQVPILPPLLQTALGKAERISERIFAAVGHKSGTTRGVVASRENGSLPSAGLPLQGRQDSNLQPPVLEEGGWPSAEAGAAFLRHVRSASIA